MTLYRVYTKDDVFDIWAKNIEELKKEVNSKIVDVRIMLES